MIAASIPMGRVDPPIAVRDGTNTVLIVRRHRAARGKVTVGYRRPAGGVGMATFDDTDRFAVSS